MTSFFSLLKIKNRKDCLNFMLSNENIVLKKIIKINLIINLINPIYYSNFANY